MDFFSEHIVKRRKTPQDVMSIIISIMVAGILVYGVLLQFLAGKLVILIPFETALIAFGVFLVISSFKVEYEYSVTNGDLDIDKIKSKRGRKNFLRLQLKDVEYFALLDDDNISIAEDRSIKQMFDATSTIDSPNVYFMIFYLNGQKSCLLFEPTEDMIENFAYYIPRSLNHTL